MTDFNLRYREWLEAHKGQPLILSEINPYNQGLYRGTDPDIYLRNFIDYFRDLGCGVAIARKLDKWYELKVNTEG